MEAEKEFAEKVVNAVREGLLILDSDLRVRSANDSFYRLFGVDKAETEGRLIYELGNGQWDIPELRELLEEILPEKETFDDYEVEHDFENIGYRSMLLNARRIDHLDLILLAIEDVTERKQARRILERQKVWLEEQVQERTKELSQLMQRLTFAEQAERNRIARLLHDDLQQRLFALRLGMSVLGQTIEENSRAGEELGKITAQLDQAMQLTRNLSRDLSPTSLAQEDLVRIVETVAERKRNLYDLEVQINAQEEFRMADRDRRLLLYRALRELLFNVVKHADTHQAGVDLSHVDDELVLTVSDQGRGFEPAESERSAEGGFGLRDLRERLRFVRGRLEVESKPGQGTRVSIYLPLSNDE